jgi:hypothetical protein
MSYDDDPGYSERQWKAKTDKLARIACRAMAELEKQGRADFLMLDNQEVREWWIAHKEADAQAQAAREEKKRREQVKKDALAKLTTEEKKVLGIK